MSGFAALMALSATQTRATQSAVESAILQRKRNEEVKRKQQEERERKERELECKMRLQHFEAEKREQEERRRLEREAQERVLVLQRREEQQREALRYGPKKPKPASTSDTTPKWPTSNTIAHAREGVRRRRAASDDDDDSTGATALTREEKRERKLQADLKRTFHPAKRSSHTGAYSKAGKRLPGGAFDTMASPSPADSGLSNQSVKARIAAIPNTLTKLNVVKRDTRTIDEILQDRAKARDVKILDGDEAREFNDWFGKAKKKEPVKKTLPLPVSAPTSRSNTPTSQPWSLKGNDVPGVVPLHKTTTPKPSTNTGNKQPASVTKNSSTLTKPNSSAVKPSLSNGSTSASTAKSKTSSASTSSSSILNGRHSTKKRTRSPSFSESSPSPPAKRRAASPTPSRSAFGPEIWKMFGKDRTSYMQRDVYSDDEDMEVNAALLEKEELRSYRIAQKEDQAALEEERRREEEKRRRKKERERRA